ncbi:MAG TPA: hypothetical protein VGI90_04600 [Steroidobacteraceae bacterium]|jgi:hypothetical protein
MPTAQQLVDMSTELTDVVKSINAIVGRQHLPFDADTVNLSNAAFLLAAQANSIGQAGLAALADDLQTAIAQLTAQVAAANSTLRQVNEVKQALTIVGVILTGAACVATNVATGNWMGAAGGIATMAKNLETAIASVPPTAGPGPSQSAAAKPPARGGKK